MQHAAHILIRRFIRLAVPEADKRLQNEFAGQNETA